MRTAGVAKIATSCQWLQQRLSSSDRQTARSSRLQPRRQQQQQQRQLIIM